MNIAADYCVNSDLIEQRVGEKIPVGLYDNKYQGWSAEEVYDDLYEKADKIDISDLMDQLLDEHLDGEGEGDEDQEGEGKGRPRLSAEEKRQLRDEIREAMLQAA